MVRVALISLMRLNSEKSKTHITEKLTDSGNGVIKTAQELYIKYNIEDYNRTLYEVFHNK